MVRTWVPFNRMVYIYTKLNAQEIYYFYLMDALRLYMFIITAEYWEIFSIWRELPDQIFIIFLREGSNDLQEFLLNHLKNVGNGRGLEMVRIIFCSPF